MASGPISERRTAYVHLRRRTEAAIASRRRLVVGLSLLAIGISLPAHAQQANQPGYDPVQTEKRFERQQSDQAPAGRPKLPTPQFARPQGPLDTKPIFLLRRVSVTGATAIPLDRLATAYQPYLGKYRKPT